MQSEKSASSNEFDDDADRKHLPELAGIGSQNSQLSLNDDTGNLDQKNIGMPGYLEATATHLGNNKKMSGIAKLNISQHVHVSNYDKYSDLKSGSKTSDGVEVSASNNFSDNVNIFTSKYHDDEDITHNNLSSTMDGHITSTENLHDSYIERKYEHIVKKKTEYGSSFSILQGPIIALALGLAFTSILFVLVAFRLCNMRRRLRKGRLLHANEADYLINGMYL